VVRVPAVAGNFSLHHRIQTGSGAHPASYRMVQGDLALGVKWPGREADHSPPSSSEVEEWVELYLHFLNTPSWRGAQLNYVTCSGVWHDPHVAGAHLHCTDAVSQFFILPWHQQASRIHFHEARVSVEHPVQLACILPFQTRVPDFTPATTSKHWASFLTNACQQTACLSTCFRPMGFVSCFHKGEYEELRNLYLHQTLLGRWDGRG
jgi:hypothetical protein